MPDPTPLNPFHLHGLPIIAAKIDAALDRISLDIRRSSDWGRLVQLDETLAFIADLIASEPHLERVQKLRERIVERAKIFAKHRRRSAKSSILNPKS